MTGSLIKPKSKLSDSLPNPNDETRDQEGSFLSVDESALVQVHPEQIGRYLIRRVLGKGGFGLVYLGLDEQLDRLVAVKVPHQNRISKPKDAEAYLAEARAVANLDHSGIVQVHDVGSTDTYPYYIVSKYIEGTDLSTMLKSHRLSFTESAELIATVADALHYAHKQGLVHRDVKPSNILIGIDGKPYVVDFGLALREENIGKGPRLAGTPAYMSPEQARGEGHRVDGRSDIFSLGVVLYRLLVGRRPFRGDTQAELLEQVTTYEPRPLRQYDETLPKELERICYKAISKRACDRYSSAHDFAEDLRHFLAQQTEVQSGTLPTGIASAATAVAASGSMASETEVSQIGSTSLGSLAKTSASIGLGSSTSHPIKIVPKGLRSFDSHDADFFLELLPGPRDREGLPGSLRFWKTQIEESDPDNTFSVGLIYGPSGCGKSSLVKAGLLPQLRDEVIPVYIESTPEDTESRLLLGLRKRFPILEQDLTLQETLTSLRRGQGIPNGKKVVIFLDQFEQWLHAKKDERHTELVQALRQCDGGRVQCVVMVRDDFWLAVSRFLRDLEVPLVEGHNVALADLFDLDHARRVLAAFGRAFGKLPENISETTKEQKEFLKQAVAGLAEEGKVICVRLALFAEMMKSKPWTLAAFKEVGGTQGIGVTFLEETFSSSAASPEHRLHQKAARAVLKDLLPDAGTNIKGHMRSHGELLDVCGYGNRLREFDNLIRILDSEVRLVTPTDPEGADSYDTFAAQTESGNRYFQLAHDYLVPSLRNWLNFKQKETRQGRAELQLAERSTSWNAKPETRFLPSWRENLSIRALTDKSKWTQSERKMMNRSGVVHGLRTAMFGLVLAAIVIGGFAIRNVANNRQRSVEATRLVEGLLQADTSQVKTIIANLGEFRQLADDDLTIAFASAPHGSNAKLHAGLAMLPNDKTVLPYLQGCLLDVSPIQFKYVRDLLAPHKNDLKSELWKVAIEDAELNTTRRFQAVCALASYDPDNEYWSDPPFVKFVAWHLTRVLPSHLLPWRDALRPVQTKITAPLAAIYRDQKEGEQVRSFATDTLADYRSGEANELFELLADANEIQFGPMFDTLVAHRDRAVELAINEINKPVDDDASEEEKESLAMRQANAAVMLARMDSEDHVWPLLKFRPDPRLRSYIIHWLSPRGAHPAKIINRLTIETDVTIKRALVLCLGEFDPTLIQYESRTELIDQLVDICLEEPDAGLHAAADWLLRTWGHVDAVNKMNVSLRRPDGERIAEQTFDKQWFINESGQTFVVLDAGEFQMGSPESEPDRYGNEQVHLRRINRQFAMATKQVTKAQYREFCKTNDYEYHPDKDSLQIYIQTEDSPMISMRWYEAAAYCNWLSEQEGIPEDQWCFEPNEDGEYAAGMKAKDNFLELSGYRLPTEPEWEFACRAGTTTSRYYGLSKKLLTNYAWFSANNETRTMPVGTKKPNDFGLFDMQGNCFDWCYDEFVFDPAGDEDSADDAPNSEPTQDTDNRMLRGGGFINPEANTRSAARYFSQPNNRRLTNSFRVVRTIAD